MYSSGTGSGGSFASHLQRILLLGDEDDEGISDVPRGSGMTVDTRLPPAPPPSSSKSIPTDSAHFRTPNRHVTKNSP